MTDPSMPTKSENKGTIPDFAIQGLAKSVGWSDDESKIAMAIAMAESGGRVGAVGGPNKDGTYDYGLWQINGSHFPDIAHWGAWDEPGPNALMARDIFVSQGWHAWSTYNDGSYKKHLPKGFIESIPTPLELLGMAGSAAGDAASTVLSYPFKWMQPVFDFIKTGAITVGAFLLSVVLLIGGFMIMTRKSGIVKNVGKTVAGAAPLLAA